MHAGQVDLHPLLVDHPAAVGAASSPAPTGARRRACARRCRGEHSVTRSWLSWLVMSVQPLVLARRRGCRPAPARRRSNVALVSCVADQCRSACTMKPGRVGRHDDDRDALVLLRRPGRCAPRARCSRRRSARRVKIFWPLMTYSSPSRTAVVVQRREVGAGVGLGVADRRSGSRRRGSSAGRTAFCSSVPNSMIVGPTVLMREHRDRRAGPHRLVEEDELLDRRRGPGRRTPSASRCRASRRRPSGARPSRQAGPPVSPLGAARPRPRASSARRSKRAAPGGAFLLLGEGDVHRPAVNDFYRERSFSRAERREPVLARLRTR